MVALCFLTSEVAFAPILGSVLTLELAYYTQSYGFISKPTWKTRYSFHVLGIYKPRRFLEFRGNAVAREALVA